MMSMFHWITLREGSKGSDQVDYLVVLSSSSAGHAFVAPALTDGVPLGGKCQSLAFLQDESRERRRQFRPQRHGTTSLVLHACLKLREE